MRSFLLLFPLLSVALGLAPPATKNNRAAITTKTFDAPPPQRNAFTTAATIFGVAAATPFPAFAADLHMPHMSVNLGFVLMGYGMIGNLMLAPLFEGSVDTGIDAASMGYGVVDVDAATLEQSVDMTTATIDMTTATIDAATAATVDATMGAGIDNLSTLI